MREGGSATRRRLGGREWSGPSGRCLIYFDEVAKGHVSSTYFVLGAVMISVATLAVLILAPIWPCPYCDDATYKPYPGSAPLVKRFIPSECPFCNRSGNKSMYQRWSILRTWRENGVYIPLIP